MRTHSNSIRSFIPSHRNIKIGGFVVLGACLLHFFGLVPIIFATMMFSVFTLYLYVQSLNQQIIQLKNQFGSTSLIKESNQKILKQAKEISPIPTSSSNQLVRGEKDLNLDKNIEVFTNRGDEPEYFLRIRNLEENLIQKEETISQLKNSIEALVQRLDSSASLVYKLAQFKNEFVTKEGIKFFVDEFNSNSKSLPLLEARINNLETVGQSLISVCRGDLEIEKRKEEMQQRLLQLIREFEEKLNQYFEQLPQARLFENRMLIAESKIDKIPALIQTLVEVEEKITDQDAKIRYIGKSIAEISAGLNTRIDSLEMLQESSQDYSIDKSQTINQAMI